MSLPKEPLSRQEQYLNKIATGDGELPDKPLSRVEQYLSYMCENGLGGGSSTSEYTDLGEVDSKVIILHPDINEEQGYIAIEHSSGMRYLTQKARWALDASGQKIVMDSYYYISSDKGWNFKDAKRSGYASSSVSSYIVAITNNESYAEDLKSRGFKKVILKKGDEVPVIFKHKRGDNETISDYVGECGEILVNTNDYSIHVMDGVTVGGHKISPDSIVLQAKITDLEERILSLENAISSMQV